jgi:hypothetical protein
MFGRDKQRAQATIVARQTHEGSYRKGVQIVAPTGLYHHVYDYVADVTPGGTESPFRATFTEMFESDEEYRPIAGDTVAVRFNKDRNVAFDRDALRAEAQARKRTERSDFAAIASAPVGTLAPDAAVPAAAVPPSDPRVAILELSLRQAQRRGDTAEVSRLSAQLAALRSTSSPPAS